MRLELSSVDSFDEARDRVKSLGLKAVGAEVYIFPLARLLNPRAISLGDHVIIDDYVVFDGGTESSVGSYVHIASFSSITGGGTFEVADFATISSGCRILNGSEDLLGGGLVGAAVPPEFRDLKRSFVRLEKHAMLGANVIVLPGVTIGEGAAVGAGSLVSSDAEPWTVNAGAPARPIRRRPRKKMLDLEKKLREGM